MSQNKFMHPRNIYNKPVDYTSLAIKYPEFRKICKLELNGKVSINFKAPTTLETLTRTLLQNDFELDVKFPENSLIPTIPLRVNYILWMEDLMNLIGAECPSGIDIGCGAACIYGLLCAKKFNWKMACIETQKTSIESAVENIERNNLSDLIQIHQQCDKSKIFDGTAVFVDSNKIYDFCLCNPPFHDNSNDNRKYRKRKLPNNHKSGNDNELLYDGGEINFVTKIIRESVLFKSKIRIFSSMLGCKKSLSDITKILDTENITNYTETEFCQGHVTRWGIAWTFQSKNDIDLSKCIKYFSKKKKEKLIE